MDNPVKNWRRQKVIRNLLNLRGRILSWTEVAVSNREFSAFAPYVTALVELEDGQRVFGQVVDTPTKQIKTGAVVISVLRRIGKPKPDSIINYGLKFKILPNDHA
jgi:hypothetical protein